MTSVLLTSPDPVTLLGGGETSLPDLSEALTKAPRLVAADGGARLALAQGRIPDAVIGDMDSLRPEDRAQVPPERLFHIPEQDTTDFDKALRSMSAPAVLGLGFLGARVDHELANLSVLVRRPSPPCLLVGAQDVIWAAPAEVWIDLSLPPGTRVSLFPMAPVSGQSEGLKWSIDGLCFAPGGVIGTSNRTDEGKVRLRFADPGMLVLLPRSALEQAWSALLAGAEDYGSSI